MPSLPPAALWPGKLGGWVLSERKRGGGAPSSSGAGPRDHSELGGARDHFELVVVKGWRGAKCVELTVGDVALEI